ncbi:MAG: prolipoprotein diacylglyceryl transferase [Candidatus Omnitrophota bacterium]|nr:prolipoprotein diacylglyceryl transferase [Candidatus Omnitrophota bacterium]
MHPILFKLGSITIYTYGVFVFLGLILGFFFAQREACRLRIDVNKFTDIIFWTALTAFAGARLLYVIIEYRWFLERPLEIVFSRSGFVFLGGIIFGLIPLYLLTKKHKISFLKMADCIAIGLPLGHSLGRLGCFFYGCCYGRSTSSFIGVLFPSNSAAGMLGEKVIPTQLISSFFLFLIFLTLFFLRKYKRFSGQLFVWYLWLYGFFRFIIELFRGDDRGTFWGFSPAQIISVILILIGTYIFLKKRRSSLNSARCIL